MSQSEYGPLKLISQCPVTGHVLPYADEPAIRELWHDAIKVAAETPEVVKSFEDERGVVWPYRSFPSETVLRSAGYDHAVVMQFVDWFNETIWRENENDGKDG